MFQIHSYVVGHGQVVEVEGPVLLLPPVGVKLQELEVTDQHQDAQHHTTSTPRLYLKSVPLPSDADFEDSPT